MNDSNTINKGSLPGLKEKRYLQKNVETLAAKLILQGDIGSEDVILIDVEGDKLTAKIK